MMKALLWKELRGSWLCALPFALLMGWVLISVLSDFRNPILSTLDLFPRGRTQSWAILEDAGLLTYVGFSSIGLGLVLGLWQTIPESVIGTAPFFAHVARSRARILAAKIAVALFLLFGTLIVPVGAIVGGLIASGGPRPWGQLWDVSIHLGAGLVVYFGTLAIGVRGLPWKEWIPKMASVGLIGFMVFFALNTHLALVPLYLLAGGLILSAAWAVTGSATREF